MLSLLVGFIAGYFVGKYREELKKRLAKWFEGGQDMGI